VTIAKVVTLRARSSRITVLDDALTHARGAAAAEPGTTAWEWFPGADACSRVIIELFADETAAAEHDASPAVELLLARFADVLATDPDVRIYTRTPYATTTEEEST